jgi:hypothetical protein
MPKAFTKVLVFVLSFLTSGIARAQKNHTVELETGGGYVFGNGPEDPGPSLPTFTDSFVLWPTVHWGVAIRLVEGPGEDLYASPVQIADRTFLGEGNLHYLTLTARHRNSLALRTGLEVGFGMMFGETFGSIEILRESPRRVSVPNGPAYGLSLEALVSHSLFSHLIVKAGATYDFEFETNHFQPVILGVVGF